jgi:hypothetical protein
MGVHRIEICLLKNKLILSKDRSPIPVANNFLGGKIYGTFSDPPKTGHFESSRLLRPDTVHCIQKPDSPAENRTVDSPRNSTNRNRCNNGKQVGRWCRSLVPILAQLCDCCQADGGFCVYAQFWIQEHIFHSYTYLHIRTWKLIFLEI